MIHFRSRIKAILSILIVLNTIIHYGYSATLPNNHDLFTVNITMTNFQTTKEDEYAFVQYKLPDEELMIVGYSPLITMNSAHHMLTFACETPGSNEQIWTIGGSCNGKQTIIHGWARNAPEMRLPENVGFAVGRNTPYKYIVVNIHYLSILKNDNSGNQLILTRQLRKYQAGVLLAGTSQIYLKSKTHTIRTPFSCRFSGPPIYIFAVRVHAHQWGRVNSLYRVRDGEISQIAKGDPQWPQSFYPLSSSVEIQPGDYFVGQCVYDNNDDRDVHVGATHNDEMCNVYAMYSYEPVRTSSGQQKPNSAPLDICWGNQDSKIARLIPPESEIPPLKPADIGETKNDMDDTHAEYTINPFPASLYKSIETWPNVNLLPTELGQVGGIALNNENNELIVFHRGSRKWDPRYFDGYRFRNEIYGPIEEDVLIHIDTSTGETKYRWGAKMFYMSHGLTIDHEGNFWLTDVAMHQVLMFKPNNLTHPILTVGDMFQPGSGHHQLCRPADVAVMKNGDFFVADGYCNSRIIKFNRKGEYIMEWGTPVTGRHDGDGFPLANEWNIVHSVALHEDAQLLCGADRENFRIQCFNSKTGEFQRQIHVEKNKDMSAIYAIEFVPNTNETILFAVTGRTMLPNNKVYMIEAQSGDILTSFDSNTQLMAPHDITVSRDAQEIYLGELASSPVNALHKFKLSKYKDIPKQTFNKPIHFNDKNFRISFFIMIAFAIPILVSVIIGCIVRMKNMGKLRRLNILIVNAKNEGRNRGSALTNWIKQRNGFQRLEQYSDAENEPIDTNISDDSNNNSDEETINVTPKWHETAFSDNKH